MSDPVFSYISYNPFGLGNVGSYASPTFADIDSDGDLDAFVGSGDGNTLFFKNTGTANNPLFTAAVNNPFGLSDIGFSANPSLADIDGDNDLDAFIGENYGNIQFFRNIGTVSNPIFAASVTNPFGLSDVGLYANPTFVDIDGDGDLDIFVGNEKGTQFFKNTGTASSPVFAISVATPYGLSDMYGYGVSPTFFDIENDGDLDAFIGWGGQYNINDGIYFYRNTGTSTTPVLYYDSVNPFGLSSVGGYRIKPVFVDIDDDGDVDAFVGNGSGNTLFFQNAGTGYIHHFSWSYLFGLQGLGYNPDPTFVDIDGDGDLDAFVGKGYSYNDTGAGDTLFFENTGTAISPVFAAGVTNPFGLKNVGSLASPTFVDIDGDTDLDAFVGNDAGNVLYFKNIGNFTNPAFSTSVTNPFGLSSFDKPPSSTFADIDNDGDLDAFVNNLYIENTGTVSNPVFAVPETDPFGLGYNPTFTDTDNDGDLDTLFFRNTGTASNPVFFRIDNIPILPVNFYRSYVTSQTFIDIDGDGDLDAYITGNYEYGAVHPWDGLLINNNAPNVADLTASEVYTKNTPLNLKDIVASDPDSANITAILNLSNSTAGSLNTATSGNVTSTYNGSTGIWTASGAIADVNALLASLIFTPAKNFNGAFKINTSISDGAAASLLGSKNFSVLLVSTTGNDILTGTSFDNDTVTYASSTGAVTVSLNLAMAQNTIGAGSDTLSSVENLIGSPFNDDLTGNSLNNVLEGKAGNDTLRGWSGADTMTGGLGNDRYFVENSKDVVTEKFNEGTDSVSSNISYTLPVNVENLTLTGTAAINGTGNSQNNIITGNNAANQLIGDAGNDTLNSGAGDDTLTGWSGADIMSGGLGNDTYFVENVGDKVNEKLNEGNDNVNSKLTYTLPANVEKLTLTGTLTINGTGNDLANVIMGNNAANQLNGSAGNDILDGGLGANKLTGGIGNDIFRFSTKGHIDQITDYNVTNDIIQLENAVFIALTSTGTLAASQFKIGTKALDANDFIIYNKTTGSLLYDSDGNGTVAAIQIATIGTGLNLTNADIVVI